MHDEKGLISSIYAINNGTGQRAPVRCFHFYLWVYAESIYIQGIRIKGREMALVWQEKSSPTALQTSSLLHIHTLLIQTLNMTTVNEIAEQCRQL